MVLLCCRPAVRSITKYTGRWQWLPAVSCGISGPAKDGILMVELDQVWPCHVLVSQRTLRTPCHRHRHPVWPAPTHRQHSTVLCCMLLCLQSSTAAAYTLPAHSAVLLTCVSALDPLLPVTFKKGRHQRCKRPTSALIIRSRNTAAICLWLHGSR